MRDVRAIVRDVRPIVRNNRAIVRDNAMATVVRNAAPVLVV